MPRTTPHLSSYAVEAARLLGLQVAQGRRERRWTITELAERAGVSRPTVRKVEKGDPTVSIGVAFEVAALVGVTLFVPEVSKVAMLVDQARDRLSLLPDRVTPPPREVHDDF